MKVFVAIFLAVTSTFLVVSGMYTNFGKPVIREDGERIVIVKYAWPSIDIGSENYDRYTAYPKNFSATQDPNKNYFSWTALGPYVMIAVFHQKDENVSQCVEYINFYDPEVAYALRTARSNWESVAAAAFALKKKEMKVKELLSTND